jgi:hypothetical protein
MPSYRRVNIDGHSVTETRLASANLKPGIFVAINADDEFEAAPVGAVGRVYVLGAAEHEGLGITDEIPSGHSAVGNYVEDGREFAVLAVAGVYKKDQPIGVGANGLAAGASVNVIGFCQDDVSFATADFIRVRMRSAPAAAAVTAVEVTPATASVEAGATTQLTATVSPAAASSAVTWTSSDITKATVDATGLVTGVAAGSATITATSVADNTKTDTAAITVTSA